MDHTCAGPDGRPGLQQSPGTCRHTASGEGVALAGGVLASRDGVVDPSEQAPTAREAAAGQIAIAAIRDGDVSVDECLTAVRRPGVGGVAVFVGTVRDHDGGRGVAELEYTAHPRAGSVIAAVAADVAAAHRVCTVAVTHRVGLLAIGDIAVVAAVGAVHRAEAFAACRQLIDDVKAQVPIWKRQVFLDGSSEWVGVC